MGANIKKVEFKDIEEVKAMLYEYLLIDGKEILQGIDKMHDAGMSLNDIYNIIYNTYELGRYYGR